MWSLPKLGDELRQHVHPDFMDDLTPPPSAGNPFAPEVRYGLGLIQQAKGNGTRNAGELER